MSWFYRKLVRPVLFTHDPEEIHETMLKALGWASRQELVTDAMAGLLEAPALPVEVMGLRFPNPVGLAAGMDKQAEALPAWAAFGFGFSELGAVTLHPQPGNPRPRLFRAIADEAIVNRMGFNNPGAEAVAQTLAEWRKLGRWPRHPVGMNLGKSKITPLDKAAEDYAGSFRLLAPWLDFFVVNVSSPNTPNLRQLQDKAALDEILAAIEEAQPAEASMRKPILIKVAPDLSFEALDQIVDLTEKRSVAGLVATNTTITRPETQDAALRRIYREEGGLSGRPLRARSTEIVRHLYQSTRGALPIIGVGGIFTAEDAWEKVVAGASLLQIYTSLVYEGPWVVSNLVRGLLLKLEELGLEELKDSVGIGCPRG
jgi:dihydroorotate dehydrogenase